VPFSLYRLGKTDILSMPPLMISSFSTDVAPIFEGIIQKKPLLTWKIELNRSLSADAGWAKAS
jgi:hypothetical protein